MNLRFASAALSSIASSLYTGEGPDNECWHGLGGCAGNSDVGMIIFGTISGGAGAHLTGGNFWQGAVTGLIVSGLNHAMHVLKQKNQSKEDVRQALKDNGYNLDEYAKLSFSELVNFAEKILPVLYSEAGKPVFLDGQGKYNADGFVESDANSGFTTKIDKVYLNKGAFKSFLKLATTIGHELNHVIDNNNGNYTKWLNFGGEKYRKAKAELNSYIWQLRSNADFNLSDFSYHRSYTDILYGTYGFGLGPFFIHQ